MESVSTRMSLAHRHLTHHQPLLASSLDAAAGRFQILAMHCASTASNAMESVAMLAQTNMANAEASAAEAAAATVEQGV